MFSTATAKVEFDQARPGTRLYHDPYLKFS